MRRMIVSAVIAGLAALTLTLLPDSVDATIPKLGLCIPEYGLQHQFWLDMGNEVGGFSHDTLPDICAQNHPVYEPS